MTELEQLTVLCERLGAARSQAETMAAQLLKRADQLAQERGIERTDALKYLLQVVTQGRKGEAAPQFSRTLPPAT